jgi:hypothetical protein
MSGRIYFSDKFICMGKDKNKVRATLVDSRKHVIKTPRASGTGLTGGHRA